ncbi:MAG: hypothetical protein G8345_04100 [Magnetococcales bacterium]|nr:hypothetical protein [Magnetococcales bacterium]NGZ26054.1 hypothetical protein [Magnetococcales bacterium]
MIHTIFPLLLLLMLLFPLEKLHGAEDLPLLKVNDPCMVHFLATNKTLFSNNTLDYEKIRLYIHLTEEADPQCRLFPNMRYNLYLISDSLMYPRERGMVIAPIAKPPDRIKISESEEEAGSWFFYDGYYYIDVTEQGHSKGKKRSITRKIHFNLKNSFMTIKGHPDPSAIIPLYSQRNEYYTRFFTMTRFKNIPIENASLRHYEDLEDRECAGMPFLCPRYRRCFALAAQDGREAVYCLPWAYEWKKIKLVGKGDVTKPNEWLAFEATEAYAPTFESHSQATDWQGLYSRRVRQFKFNLQEGWIDDPTPPDQTLPRRGF